jgi:serine phosphatase RsbU (regulator of sigma subunit)
MIATFVITAVLALTLARTRQQLGVQGLRGDSMLLELRDRLRRQGEMPELPEGWGSQVVLLQAGGSSFGGDFVVSSCDGKTLEVALIDVSGKGIDAGTRALLLSGALGGLLGAVPPDRFLHEANRYLLRQAWEEGFATAVHLILDVESGDYRIETAGHPPVVHFDAGSGRWRISELTGVALGLLDEPAYDVESGRLRPGDALLLYTDGVVEIRGRDLSVGIDKLLGEAERLVPRTFAGGARLVLDTMRTGGASDDRALVMIWRR